METTMTMLSVPFISSASAEHRRSIWRRMLDTIEAGRQRKAEQHLAKFLRSNVGFYGDEFRIELERRLRGQ